MAHLGASTSSIRIGSGGVMLPNHAPLVVAEQFAMLEALHPGRVDLGIGRAPGTDPATAAALRRTTDLGADDFPRDLLDLMGLLGDERVEHGAWSRFRATPAATSSPQIVLLGSSGYSAQVAGQLGLGFGFAHHFDTGGVLQACELYRDSFRPSAAARRAVHDRDRRRARRRRPRAGRVPRRSGPAGDPRHPHQPPHAAAAAGRGRRARRHRRRPVDAVDAHRRRRAGRRRRADGAGRADPGVRADDLDDDVRAAGAHPHAGAARRALADVRRRPDGAWPTSWRWRSSSPTPPTR